MAITVASLQAFLGLDKSGFEKGLKGADKELTKFEKTMGGLNSTLGQFGVQLGAGAAIAGFGMEMKKMILLGSDAEETFSKFNNIFGDFSAQTMAGLDTFAAQVGRNKFELRSFAATFGAITTGMGMSKDQAGAFSTELVKLTTDLSSFHNVAEKDVAEALRAGIIGETEPLRKFGVVLSAAAVDAELLRMGIDGGAKAASEAEKAQARLNLILAGTASAQGDATETAGSFANQMRALQSAVAEAETEIGQKLLPVVTPLVKDFAQLAKHELPGVVSGFNSMVRVGEGIHTLETSITALGTAMGVLSEKADPVTSKFSILGKLVEISMLPYQGLGDALKIIGLGFQVIGAEIALVTGRWTSFNAALSTTAALLPGLGNITANSPVPLAEGLKAIRHEINTMPSMGGMFGGMVPSGAGAGGGNTTNYYNLGGQQLGPFNGDNGNEQALIALIQILRQQLAGNG